MRNTFALTAALALSIAPWALSASAMDTSDKEANAPTIHSNGDVLVTASSDDRSIAIYERHAAGSWEHAATRYILPTTTSTAAAPTLGRAMALSDSLVAISIEHQIGKSDKTSVIAYLRGDGGWEGAGFLRTPKGLSPGRSAASMATDGKTLWLGVTAADDSTGKSGSVYQWHRKGQTLTPGEPILPPDGMKLPNFGAQLAFVDEGLLIATLPSLPGDPRSMDAFLLATDGEGQLLPVAILEGEPPESLKQEASCGAQTKWAGGGCGRGSFPLNTVSTGDYGTVVVHYCCSNYDAINDDADCEMTGVTWYPSEAFLP